MLTIVSFAARAAVGIAVAVETWARENEPDTDRRAYSLWIATMIMLSPTAWYHYVVLLLLPFIQLTAAAVAGRAGGMAATMCIVSYILADLGFIIFSGNDFLHSHQFISTEIGFMSAAAAWIGMVLFAWGTPPKAA